MYMAPEITWKKENINHETLAKEMFVKTILER
jgi:hypothetical protein